MTDHNHDLIPSEEFEYEEGVEYIDDDDDDGSSIEDGLEDDVVYSTDDGEDLITLEEEEEEDESLTSWSSSPPPPPRTSPSVGNASKLQKAGKNLERGLQRIRKRIDESTTTPGAAAVEVETVVSSQSDATGFKGTPEPSHWNKSAPTHSLSGVQEGNENQDDDEDEEEVAEEKEKLLASKSPSSEKGKNGMWKTMAHIIHSSHHGSRDLEGENDNGEEKKDGGKEQKATTGTESTASEEDDVDGDDDEDEFATHDETLVSPRSSSRTPSQNNSPAPRPPILSSPSPRPSSRTPSQNNSPASRSPILSSPSPRTVARRKSMPKPREPEESTMHALINEKNWQGLLKVMEPLRKQDPRLVAYELTKTNDRTERASVVHRAVQMAPLTLTKLLISIVPFELRHDILLLPDAKGNTPLHLACVNLPISSKTNNMDDSIVKALAAGAPDAHDVRNALGDVPLALLLTSPAMKAALDPSSQGPESLAVEAAAEDLVRTILRDRSDLSSTQNKKGQTLLHIGTAHHIHERVLLLLMEGAEYAAELSDSVGRLPLHYVASTIAGPAPPLNVAERLVLASQESLTTPCSDGNTPLHLLVSNIYSNIPNEEDRSSFGIERLTETLLGRSADESMCPLLVKNKEGHTPLHCCALHATPANIVQILMASPFAGKAANMLDSNRSTPFHILCASSTIVTTTEQIAVLGTTETSLKRDAKGRTPLHVAAENMDCNEEAMQAVIDVNPKAAKEENPKKRMPLHLAMRKKASEPVIKALLKAHPKAVKSLFEGDNGVIHEMCQYRTPANIIQMALTLYPEGAQLANKFKNLPLHVATAYQCDLPTVKALVKAFPDACTRPNKHKDLPIHYAANNPKATEVIEYLVKAAPNSVMIPNEQDETPLDQFKKKGLEGLMARALDEATNKAAKKKKKKEEDVGEQEAKERAPLNPLSSPVKLEPMDSPPLADGKTIRVRSKAAQSEDKTERRRSPSREPTESRRSRSREPGSRSGRSKSRDRSTTRGRSKSRDRSTTRGRSKSRDGSTTRVRSKSDDRSKTRGRSKSKDRSGEDKKTKKRDKSADKSVDKKAKKRESSADGRGSTREGRTSRRASSVDASSRKRDKSVDKVHKQDKERKIKKKSKSISAIKTAAKDKSSSSPKKSKSTRTRSVSPSRSARRSKSSRSLKGGDDEGPKQKQLRGRKSKLHESISDFPNLKSPPRPPKPPSSPTFLRKSKASLAVKEEMDDGTIQELGPTASITTKRNSKKRNSKPAVVEQAPVSAKRKTRGSILKKKPPSSRRKSKSLNTAMMPGIPTDLITFDNADVDDISSQMESPSAIRKKSGDKKSSKSSRRKSSSKNDVDSTESVSLHGDGSGSRDKSKKKSPRKSKSMDHGSDSISLTPRSSKSRRKGIKSLKDVGQGSPKSKASRRHSSKRHSGSSSSNMNLEASYSGGFQTPSTRRSKRGSLVDDLVESPMHRSMLLSAPDIMEDE